ncbi:MAG: aminoacyl-tRNA hydrolase [Candidatus Porifericomitaceae bacterium WSBS_2022_MAG_OTU9]
MPTPLLYVGLGNPGERYHDTRHNLGFDCIDQIARKWASTFRHQTKFSGHTAQKDKLQLLKPDTYVNESGKAVGAMANFYQIEPENIIVIHDELDLNPGIARIKLGGGHGGHNGLKDIINHLGSKDFWRIRIGIGHPGDRAKVTPFVLSKAPQQEQELCQKAIVNIIEHIDQIAAGDIAKAQEALHQNGL